MKQLKYIALTICVGLGSCSKELGKLPENAKVDGNTIINEKTARVALNGVYYQFANVQSSTNITSWRINESFPGGYAGYLGYGYGEGNDERNIYDINADVYWTYSYSIINAANGVIGAVEALPDASFTGNGKKEVLSEARFLRAYGHFKLLTYYAQWWDVNSAYGVLIRNELVTLGNIAKKRSTVAESYAAILDDLEYAITNGPEPANNIYASKYAAMLLKMRVLMSRGQQDDFTATITLADGIIGSNHYQLEDDLEDIFRNKGLASKEVILGIQPQPNQEKYFYNRSRQYWPGASALYVAKTPFHDLLQNDPRGSWMVGDANPASPGTYYFTKYIAQGSNPTTLSETAYAMRLAEVYLLKAEAIVRSGGSLDDARTELKTVMTRAGVADFQEVDNAATPLDMQEQLFLETVRNLAGEDGHEWRALLRLPFDVVRQYRPTITSTIQYILPVPINELRNNPSFGEQNPGYQQ